MANQYVGKGEHIDYTPSGAVAEATLVQLTDRACFADRAIAAGELGALLTTGLIKYAKTTGTAWTLGQKLYFDSSEDEVCTVTDTNANKVVGYAGAAAASGDAEGFVLLGT